MMTDIFSSFDPATSLIYHNYSPVLFWSLSSLSLTLIHSSFWINWSRYSWLSSFPMSTMYSQSKQTFSIHLKGFPSLLVSLFSLLILVNLLGLLPYAFSTSSHLLFTLSLGLPIWLSLIISASFHAPKSVAANLLPSGAPDWLNPFLVLIETLSICARPITLSFRLAANMSAGHIILGLIGIYASSSMFLSMTTGVSLILIQLFYLIFEMGICLIQAYIFCLLLSLYSDDHPTE
uniref:ATP synthase subunit a n=1 Tax=Eulepethus nanhaiensis TaxID=1881687 RepID=A0A343W6G1_9ANNE|nr:ATP synthase F0 subunit 6 [Eulepethus nanhaiensis]